MSDLFTSDTPANLCQWFTPAWAAEAIVEQQFAWLPAGAKVLDPSCGDGAFLCALPQSLDVVGVEIDPAVAARARSASGRRVIVGDFLQVPLQDLGKVQAIIGNPPFPVELVSGFLERSAGILDEGGVAGFILPAYILQTSSKVERYNEKFSISQQLLPRNLFPGLKLPLVFATFTKDRRRHLQGFLLYREAQEIRSIDRRWQEAITAARDTRGAWFSVVDEIMIALGGEADLCAVYQAVQPRRPTDNPHWKEKVRQVFLRHPTHYRRIGPGRYARA